MMAVLNDPYIPRIWGRTVKAAYFDCTSGASGDMLLGAVLDALGSGVSGVAAESDEELAMGELDSWTRQVEGLLKAEEGGRFVLQRVKRAGAAALKIDFFVGKLHADKHAGEHQACSFSDIAKLIKEQMEQGRLSASAASLSLRTFEILARAEAKAHNTLPEDVHFHEVGAFDSLMDVVGFCAAFSLLGVDEVYASEVTLGSGSVKTAHGALNVPPPAVAEIVKAHRIPISKLELPGECLTPTGAALLAAVVDHWGAAPEFDGEVIEGAGAGNREVLEKPNVVRLTAGEVAEEDDGETAVSG
jgi:pyridinium-3,5-bisthiocarboxylic acid mononucleotide nickel chelatase